MLMPKKNRVAIYEYLFKEGVMVAKKDFHEPKHPDLPQIPNLEVIKALQVSVFAHQVCDVSFPFCCFLNPSVLFSESEIPWFCE
jgi:hypothetical protein